MADLLLESFDTLTPAQMADTGAWAVVGSGVVLTTGRNGQGVTGTSGATAAQNTLRTRTLSPNSDGFHGMALAWSAFPSSDAAFWALLDASGSALLTLVVTSAGAVKVYRGTASGTLLGTSAAILSGSGTWDYVEIGPVIDDTAGRVEIRVRPDGVGTATSLYVLSSVDTQPGASSGWTAEEWYLSDLMTLDDVYVSDTGGSRNRYFKGRTKIRQTVPEADRVPSGAPGVGWTPSTGSDRYAVLDEIPHTADADYLYARIPSVIRFAMTALAPDTDRVDSVQVMLIARQIASSEQQSLASSMRDTSGAAVAEVLFANAVMPTGYRAYANVWNYRTINAANAPWGTVAGVNETEFGFDRA